MRTNVDIDDRLMAEAQRVSGLKTKKEIVNEALSELIRRYRRLEGLKLEGQVEFWDDWKHEYKRMRYNPHIDQWEHADPR